MNKNKELAKNTLIITVGRISTQFISFLLLPLYTALLSTEEYGTVDLVNTYAQLLLPVVIFQMDQALLRFMIKNRDKKYEQEKCITTTFVFLERQFVVFSVLFLITAQLIKNDYLVYLYANVLAMCFSGFSFQVARGFGDNIIYSIASFLSGIVTIGFNVIFIAGMHLKAEGMLLAAIIGNVIASLVVLIKVRVIEYIKIRSFDKKLLKEMLKYAWPLIPNALIWWIVNASDRCIVHAYLGPSANGILAISHKFPTLLMTLYNIFHLSWTESAALHLHESDKDVFFSNVFDLIFKLFGTLCLWLIAVMPFVFSLFIHDNFADAYYQIPIYAIASLFNIIVGLYSVIYISEMKTGEIAKTSILAGIINIVINVVMIRHIGLFAASISSAVAFGTMALYRAIDVKRFIKQRISRITCYSMAMMLIMGFVAYYGNSIPFKIANLLLVAVYGFLLNYTNLGKVYGVIKKKINRWKN